MSAMWDLSLENGMVTCSLCAALAFRMRVSMSAIGSVMVIGLAALPHRGFNPAESVGSTCDVVLRRWLVDGGAGHQLDLVTPGSSPRCAISRRQIRHRPNLR